MELSALKKKNSLIKLQYILVHYIVHDHTAHENKKINL